MKVKTQKEAPLTIEEALDNLSILANVDPKDPYRIGLVKAHKFIVQDEDQSYPAIEWLTPNGADEVLNVVKLTYKAILTYLLDLYESEETDWHDPKTRKGVQAIMVLVGEAATKLDTLASQMDVQEKPHSVTLSAEYKKIHDFYLSKLAKKFDDGLEGDKAWETDWKDEGESLLLDTEKTGLKDFETVRSDQEYELFYLQTEEGKPYFHPALLRNIKLVCDFDESIEAPFEEDPLLRIRAMNDRDLSAAASQILREMQPLLKDFYKQKIRLKEMTIIQSLGKAIMALMLAANQRNLIQNTSGKSCLEYFNDFQMFLRDALLSAEYQKWIAYPPEPNDKVSHLLLDLAHVFCKWYFYRHSGIKQEMDGFIHRLIRKGEELQKAEKKVLSFPSGSIWNTFIAEDAAIRKILSYYPSGPLFKILDILRKEEAEEELFFEPLRQGNYPFTFFSVGSSAKDMAVLHIPTPTRQQVVSKAEVCEEFRAFLRALSLQSPSKKHLLFNLQDRTSWKELSRCSLLEGMQKQAEFSPSFAVVTICKDTDFYHQKDTYLTLDSAKDFLHIFLEHLKNPEEYGFFLPPTLKTKEFLEFVQPALHKIHEVFFKKATKLSRADRLDFIEIFYQFLSLKLLEMIKPDSISFTCKDAIDTGACMTAGFCAFIKYFSGKKIEKEEKELLRLLFYYPSLLVRERAVDPLRLNRILSALAKMEEIAKGEPQKIAKVFGPLYEPSFIKGLTIKEL